MVLAIIALLRNLRVWLNLKYYVLFLTVTLALSVHRGKEKDRTVLRSGGSGRTHCSEFLWLLLEKKSFMNWFLGLRSGPQTRLPGSAELAAGPDCKWSVHLIPDFCTGRRLPYARHLRAKP